MLVFILKTETESAFHKDLLSKSFRFLSLRGKFSILSKNRKVFYFYLFIIN